MITKEIQSGNYMEALLRASLLLGDLHRTVPVYEITIAAFDSSGHSRHLYPKCRIISHDPLASRQMPLGVCAPLGEKYLILYPACTRHKF